jgi:hypothetical protein
MAKKENFVEKNLQKLPKANLSKKIMLLICLFFVIPNGIHKAQGQEKYTKNKITRKISIFKLL